MKIRSQPARRRRPFPRVPATWPVRSPRDGLLSVARRLGRLRAAWWAEDATRPAWQAWRWGITFAALLGWVALRLGAADWYTDATVTGLDGARLPNTFATIDHPFHIAKELATVEALRHGWLPRWFPNHQGGYPAEFYPVGGDLVVAAAYLLGLGRVPLAICHKLVVIGVFLLPPLAFWALARRERLPPSVAVLATLLHLFLPGSWVAGGSRELFNDALWPNVFASYLPLFLILWGAEYLRRGDRRGLPLAVGAATLAIYSNPRSLLGIATACLAMGLVAASEHVRLRRTRNAEHGVRNRAVCDAPALGITSSFFRIPRSALRAPPLLLVGRSAVLTVLVGLLSAGLLLPLRTHQQLYTFVQYEWFDAPRDVWKYYREAVPIQVIALAGLGMVIGLLRRGFYGRVFALLLPLSYLTATLAGWQFKGLPIFAQLEGPRLMPLLRPATLFLAALAVHEAVRLVLRLVRLPGATIVAGEATVALAIVCLLTSHSPLPTGQRGLPAFETTNQPIFAAIARSAALFAEWSTPADKALVSGNPLSWHASFWVPALTGRAAYHDDWLWSWRSVDYGARGQMSDHLQAVDLDFLTRHGLTMLLIHNGRDDLIELAATKPYLRLLDPGAPGGYAIYRVESPPGAPNGWITFGDGGVTALDLRPEHLTARGHLDRAGWARILINDFPGWRARVNGVPTAISPTEDGYMAVPVPAGDVTVEVEYTVAPVVWFARGLVTLGVLLLLALLVRGRESSVVSWELSVGSRESGVGSRE